MAVLFADPCQFDNDFLWDGAGGVVSIANQPVYNVGTSGPLGDRFISSANSALKIFPTLADVRIGFWFRPNTTTTNIVAEFRDGTSVQCQLQSLIVSGGNVSLRLINGSAGATLGTSVNSWNSSGWVWVELSVVFGNSAAFTLKVDGSTEFTGTGDTTTTANNSITRVNLGSSPAYGAVYIGDSSGSAPWNTFSGPLRGGISLPTGVGTFSAWPANAGTQTGAVDDSPTSDGDTTYVSSSTPGDKISFTHGGITANPALIYAVVRSSRRRRDDAGPRTARSFFRNSGGSFQNAATETEGAAYVTYNYLYQADPFTSAAWTKANFNSYELGTELVS